MTRMNASKHAEQWSEQIPEQDAAAERDPDADGGGPGLSEATSPRQGLADPDAVVRLADDDLSARPTDGGQPPDDQRSHPSDFASGGYDDRQEDATPSAARETPEDYAERERGD